MTNKNYRILQASNGQEAVRIAEATPLDVVILDIKIPEMDGLAALKRIKEIDDATEVVVVTGHADLESLHQMILENGAYDYLLKPINTEDLKRCLQRALA